jgi:CheY-like chemotaxis protein
MSTLSMGRREQSSQAPRNILLIEDDEATSEMITECIESESSFCVRSFSSGEEVLQHLHEIKEANPSLFIIDHVLPGMNGLQLFDHLQSLGTFEQVPTVIMTAAMMNEEMQAALRDRSLMLLTKPLELADLLDYLEYVHKSARQQLL